MGNKKKAPVTAGPIRKTAPLRTEAAHEQHMIDLAVKLAERQLEEGTASSQLICHYLKLASQKEKTELEKTKAETELAKAKVQAIKDQANIQELYAKALQAMKEYSPTPDSEDEFDEEL